MAKFLFWGAFAHFEHPGELLALDLIVLALEISHRHPTPFGSRLLPLRQCPIVAVSGNSTSFAEIESLFRCRIETDDVRTIHRFLQETFPRYIESRIARERSPDSSSHLAKSGKRSS